MRSLASQNYGGGRAISRLSIGCAMRHGAGRFGCSIRSSKSSAVISDWHRGRIHSGCLRRRRWSREGWRISGVRAVISNHGSLISLISWPLTRCHRVSASSTGLEMAEMVGRRSPSVTTGKRPRRSRGPPIGVVISSVFSLQSSVFTIP